MTDEVALSLTPEEYKSHETGAKWLFAAWYVYVSLIWSLKGIMLFFFSRVTYAFSLLFTEILRICLDNVNFALQKNTPRRASCESGLCHNRGCLPGDIGRHYWTLPAH